LDSLTRKLGLDSIRARQDQVTSGKLRQRGRTTKKWRSLAQNNNSKEPHLTINRVCNLLKQNIGGGDGRPTTGLGLGDPSLYRSCFRTSPAAEEAVGDTLRSGQFSCYAPTGGILPARETLVDENTAAMVIINPKNPCGNVDSYQYLNEISECIKRCLEFSAEPATFIQVKLELSLLEDITNDMDFCLKLAEAESVIILPGSAVGMKNWLRITFAVDPLCLEDGLERVRAYCIRHSQKD
ncbi:hypothetical protein CRG98_028286, partial [Punica granatum]